MSSEPTRNQVMDHLVTPENAVLVVIDYQPTQVRSIKSMDHEELVTNVVTVITAARTYGLPIVLSTVNVENGRNKPTLAPILEAVGDVRALDRTTINAWEDVDVRRAIEATGRRKLIIAALWTEACLLFPALDVMRLGYDVIVPVDAVGGTSVLAHETALRVLTRRGARLSTIASLLCELQRDWARGETVPTFVDLLFKRTLKLV